MDKYVSVKDSMLKFQLKQIGAEIFEVNGIMCYVEMKIGNTKIKYLYHIDKNNKYTLKRIFPYNMKIDNFDSEKDIIELIKKDIYKFKNAQNSNKFNDFINTSKEFEQLVKNFENIYLHYNVSKYDLKDIKTDINNIKEKINKVMLNNELVYAKNNNK